MDIIAQGPPGVQGEDRFEILTQAVPQLIWWADTNGDIDFVTSRTLQYFGVPLEELAGRKWIQFVHPDDQAKSLQAWNRAVADRTIFELEIRLRRSDGEHISHLSKGQPILDDQGNLTGFIRTSTDITIQKRAEAALRQVEKLAEVGKLASCISHEINNPLEAVTNLLYLLAGNRSLDATARAYLQSATEELARISEIATQTLRFHKHSTVAVPTRMYEVLDSVLSLYRPRISSARLILLREYQSTEVLTCHAGEIRQALANIIGNAIDAAPKGGRLRVRLRPSRDWKTRQQVGIRITVGENGHGIEQGNRSHIFDPFFTTKGVHGTGLGLWITKDLLTKRHGTISVRSSTAAQSSGTVISIFLPYEFVEEPVPYLSAA